MKSRIFYFIVLPAIFTIIVFVTPTMLADRVYLLSVAPAVWLTFFTDILRLSSLLQLQLASLPGIFIVGFILFKLKTKAQATIFTSIVLSLILWMLLCIWASKGTLIKVPGAVIVWYLCVYNFSLCLLPFIFLPIKVIKHLLLKKQRNK